MDISISLPEGFESLQAFAAQWAGASTTARMDARLQSSSKQRQTFYKAASEKAAAALEYLDGKAIESFDDGEQCLMNLMLSLAHVALAEEVQRDHEDKQAELRKHMHLTRSIADG